MAPNKETTLEEVRRIAENTPLPVSDHTQLEARPVTNPLTSQTIEEHGAAEIVGVADEPQGDTGTVAPRGSPEPGHWSEWPEVPIWPEPDWLDRHGNPSLQEELDMVEDGEEDYASHDESDPAEDGPVIELHVEEILQERAINWEIALMLAMVLAAFPWRGLFAMVVAIFSWRGLAAYLRRSD